MKKILASLLVLCLSLGILAGCGNSNTPAQSGGKKTFVFGDTTFNAENEESTINPHEAYSGWACIRYGIGETLMKIADDGTLEPWLAESATNINATTWEIVIKDAVCFSNGKKCDAAAVKACLEHLIEVHERAAGNLKIASMEADGQKLTIVTGELVVVVLKERIAGIGHAVGCVDFARLERHGQRVTVGNGADGDLVNLHLAVPVVDVFDEIHMVVRDDFGRHIGTGAVRKAIAMGINKQDFVDVLLNGYGYTATGAFPDSFAFGQGIQTVSFDPDQARADLEAAGWVDTDGDGIREKNGVKLTIRWLTYPSRQELPLLAESAQSTLKDIGIDVQINCTKDHNSIRKDPTAWDIWVSANVNAGLGDPQNFFDTYCLDESVKNSGGHHSDKLEKLAVRLRTTFDPAERAKIAVEMQQQLLDDNSYVFCSFLRMSMIMKANVSGLEAHTCDFYELTADLDIQ